MYSFYVSIRYIAQNPRCIDSIHCKNPKCIVSIHAKNAKVGFVAPQAKFFTTVKFIMIFAFGKSTTILGQGWNLIPRLENPEKFC